MVRELVKLKILKLTMLGTITGAAIVATVVSRYAQEICKRKKLEKTEENQS